MQLFQRPRTLKGELQVLFLAVGSGFLVLATILLYQNGQAALRRQLAGAQAGGEVVVLGDGEHIQLAAPIDVTQDGCDGIEAVAVGGVDVEVSLTHYFPRAHSTWRLAPAWRA
jgi:hypothetical protein